MNRVLIERFRLTEVEEELRKTREDLERKKKEEEEVSLQHSPNRSISHLYINRRSMSFRMM